MMLEWNDEVSGRETLFVEVILPLAISKTYTYRVPADSNSLISVGKRVVVQFGKSKIYTAIVCSISSTPPALYEAKYILEVLDEIPVINSFQLQLWNWIAGYYLCNPGDVMQAALPAALKLASETKIMLRDSGFNKEELSDKEFLVLDALEIQPELTVNDIIKLLGQKSIFPVIKSLFEKGIIHISEELTEKYKPKIRSFLTLHPFYQDAANKKELFNLLERAPKQLEAVLAYLQLSRQGDEVAKASVMEMSNCGNSAIKALLDKEIFIQTDKVVSRLNGEEHELAMQFSLTPEQRAVHQSVAEQFKEKDVVLLHGVTSSGKTQIYIKMIEEALSAGKQVLYLLPEIALTTQIIERLKQYFGEKTGIYHSKFSDNERVEIWNKVQKKEYRVILGARSAVFLPFSDLGLVVIDEEHETSYKQYDPAPRYHARDTAIYLARLHHAKVLLGSATPSLESYFNAKTGKYGFAELTERFGNVQLPAIEVVSIEEETKKKTIQSNFTSVLVNEIAQALDQKEQVILFQNRRGYTPFLMCKTCGYSPKCIHCDVSLTYHKSTGMLHCHYCGYKQETLAVCPACGSTHIEQKGYGTEKIEDDLSYIFPQARIARMDLDTTRTKNSFQRILSDFEEHKTDILVGTQMVAKGLDFGRVTVTGIINADTLLHYPDFRAYERSFQLLSQVAGRAGRRAKQGKVVIQAFDTQHRIINQVIHHDYKALYDTEIMERKKFLYPPFFRLIEIDIKHKDIAKLNEAAERLGERLRQLFGERVLGPEFPLINKIRNYYIKTIFLKIERNNTSVQKVKHVLRDAFSKFEADKLNKGTLLQVDVDPY